MKYPIAMIILCASRAFERKFMSLKFFRQIADNGAFGISVYSFAKLGFPKCFHYYS